MIKKRDPVNVSVCIIISQAVKDLYKPEDYPEFELKFRAYLKTLVPELFNTQRGGVLLTYTYDSTPGFITCLVLDAGIGIYAFLDESESISCTDLMTFLGVLSGYKGVKEKETLDAVSKLHVVGGNKDEV